MTTLTQSPGRVIDLAREERIDADSERTAADFERLYAEFMPRVRGLVRKLVADAHLVDDLVQETFLRAYNAGMQLEYERAHPQHTQWPWLAAVARNLCLDVLRKNGTAPEHELEDEAVTLEAPGDDPELCLLATRRRESIAEALGSVSERHRRILVMKCVEGKRYDEIAAAEGISVEALKSVLARARRTFRTSYAAIAERRGLGILVGGTWLRGMAARVRSLRDRMATAVNDTAVSFMAGGPAAVNAAVTAVVLGGVAVVGAVFAPSAGASAGAIGEGAGASVRISRVASVSGSDAEIHLATPAGAPSAEVTTDSEQFDATVDVDPAPGPSPVALGQDEDSPLDTSASVDSDDLAPVENPPVSAGAQVDGGRDGHEWSLGEAGSLDLTGDGDPETDPSGKTTIDCAPGQQGLVLGTACYALDTSEDVLPTG